ncbi:hypothetical protein DDE20_01870 [Pararhodobacter oceanensis]|uniref:Primase C-terminal 2 domain-containing protein n=2 Tax=Pararhodobacter oceanensis TaxID=2172121 RepID=A0A2T8HY21_9RHOB|nr:hypothetical protein DDE20_01870 [Pararhodobacter oceanensis]
MEQLLLLANARDAGLVDAKSAENITGRIAMGMLSGKALVDAICTELARGPSAGMALDAIAPLFAAGDVVELRALDAAGGGSVAFCGRLDKDRTALAEFIARHIGRKNIYFGANPRKAEMAGTTRAASAADVAVRRAVVLDLDGKDAPDADPDWIRTLCALREQGPALVLDSGNGHHVWLRCDATDAASTTPAADAMRSLGADDMSDPPRIARLPYTVNLPTATKRKRGSVPCLALPEPADATRSNVSRPLAEVCQAIKSIARTNGLPGRGAADARTSGSASRYTADGERKTGQPAPSADLLRLSLERLPNDGPFDNRDDWLDVCHAVKGACLAAGIEAEGREAWLAWCEQWGGDPVHDQAAWDGIVDPGTGWGTLMQMLENTNPTGRIEVKAAEARHAFATQAAENKAGLSATPLRPVGPFSPNQLAPRQWLYGRSYIRGNVGLLVAPGGVGKSALAMAEAVAMASGCELLDGDKPHKPLNVLYHNGEDGEDEQKRRLAAVMTHHRVSHNDLDGRLFLTSGRNLPIQLAQLGASGAAEIVPGVVDWFVETAKALSLDLIVLDPIGAMHGLPENANDAINLLLGALRDIAEKAGVAILLVHHTSKVAAMDMTGAGAAASRGASALVDGARIVRQLGNMSEKDAVKFGVSPDVRQQYIRVDNGKANLAPAEGARWMRLVGVPLNNQTQEYPDGDHIQTVERWTPPVKGQTGITLPQKADIQAALAGAAPDERRASHLSPGWVGRFIADVLGYGLAAPGTAADDRSYEEHIAHNEVASIVAQGLQEGWLRRGDEKCSDRKTRACITMGDPVDTEQTGKPHE